MERTKTSFDKVLAEFLAPALSDGQKALEALDLPVGAEVLDVGTGVGMFAIYLAVNDFQVITGEPEADSTIYAKKDWKSNAQRFGLEDKIAFRNFDASDMPFDSARFDAVFFFGALHHIDEEVREMAVSEGVRVCKQNGAVVFFEPTQNTLQRIWDSDPQHPMAADPGYYLKDNSIEVTKLEGDIMNVYILKFA